MLKIEEKSIITKITNANNSLTIMKLKSSDYDMLVTELINLIPEHYIAPEAIADILTRLGKNAASQKLKDKIPIVKKIRSGDVGEVITSDYIDEYTEYFVPIKKLRWRDHRDMAMRGDDVLGIFIDKNQKIKFLKGEAKSNKSLSRSVLERAQEELNNDDGLPAPHALGFVIDRLKEIGETELASLLEKVQLVDGIKKQQVEHLLFTFTSSNPETLQKEAFESYEGKISQSSVCLQTRDHQEFINRVYQGVCDELDT